MKHANLWHIAAELPDPPEPPEHVPLPVLYEDAWYGKDSCRIRARATEEAEWGSFVIDLDCEGPPENHWLAYEFASIGDLNEVLQVDPDNADRFLLEHGIAPGQPFYLHATYHSSQDYFGEWDVEIDWVVTSIVPWNRERVLTTWEAFWGRKRLLVFA